MPKRPRRDAKLEALKRSNTLHPHADQVTDELFRGGDFFDRRDLLQVKYEMLRRVRIDEFSIVDAAAAFGLSRPSYYEASVAFEEAGLPGLLPKKRGPREAHKLAAPVMAFLRDVIAAEPTLRPAELADSVRNRFGVTVHPRSIERALGRAGKASRATSPDQASRRPGRSRKP